MAGTNERSDDGDFARVPEPRWQGHSGGRNGAPNWVRRKMKNRDLGPGVYIDRWVTIQGCCCVCILISVYGVLYSPHSAHCTSWGTLKIMLFVRPTIWHGGGYKVNTRAWMRCPTIHIQYIRTYILSILTTPIQMCVCVHRGLYLPSILPLINTLLSRKINIYFLTYISAAHRDINYIQDFLTRLVSPVIYESKNDINME